MSGVSWRKLWCCHKLATRCEHLTSEVNELNYVWVRKLWRRKHFKTNITYCTEDAFNCWCKWISRSVKLQLLAVLILKVTLIASKLTRKTASKWILQLNLIVLGNARCTSAASRVKTRDDGLFAICSSRFWSFAKFS